MIKNFFFFVFLIISLSYSQSVDSVVIKLEDMRCMQGNEPRHEWICNIRSYLYKNGQMIPHQETYTYDWFIKESNEVEFTQDLQASGLGNSERSEDGEYGEYFDNYLVVTGSDFSVKSNILKVGKSGDQQNITLLAKNQNGEYLTDYFICEYTNPNWQSYRVGSGYNFFLNEVRTLWSDTKIINTIQEKFYKWNVNDNPYLNYHDFFIDTDLDELETNTRKIYNAKIKCKILSGLYGSVRLGIKDPWYEDGDSLGGKIQNNPNLPNYHYASDSIILSLNSTFKGVFLDRGWPSWDPPYYSVKADEQQNFTVHDNEDVTGYFLGWEGTDVDFQHADQLETPVVFHAANAEAQAVYKGHLASSVARATGYNNGRRMAKSGSTLHLVYKDNGEIS